MPVWCGWRNTLLTRPETSVQLDGDGESQLSGFAIKTLLGTPRYRTFHKNKYLRAQLDQARQSISQETQRLASYEQPLQETH